MTTAPILTYEAALEQQHEVERTIESWQAKRGEKLAEIAAFEQDAPQQVLAGKMTPDAYSRTLAELRDHVPMIENILARLRLQLGEAKHAASIAAVVRDYRLADERRAQAEAILAQTKPLYEQIAAIEGELYRKNPRSQQLLIESERLRDGADWRLSSMGIDAPTWRQEHGF